jgi:hypothetical protein
MRRMLGIIALTVALAAVSAGAALSDGGGQAGTGPLAGLLGGSAQSGGAAPVFTCDGARKRLARLNHAIAIVSARIENGTAKNPKAAAKLLKIARARAARIEARIAANCS